MYFTLNAAQMPNITSYEQSLSQLGNVGFTIILSATGGSSGLWRTTMPSAWIDIYQNYFLYALDPVLVWSMSESGVKRWSELPTLNKVASPYVYTRARDFGLKYGAVCSLRLISDTDRKITISVARNDRELSDTELALLNSVTEQARENIVFSPISNADKDVLEGLAMGLSQSEIAIKIGCSLPNVKRRLGVIKDTLNARNTTHAVYLALTMGLIAAK